MSEECIVNIPSFALNDRKWEEYILQQDISKVANTGVWNVLVVTPIQLVAFHSEMLPLIRFCMSWSNCVLRCQCSDVICGILRDLIISKIREEGVPETAAQFFVEWVLGTIIITS